MDLVSKILISPKMALTGITAGVLLAYGVIGFSETKDNQKYITIEKSAGGDVVYRSQYMPYSANLGGTNQICFPEKVEMTKQDGKRMTFSSNGDNCLPLSGPYETRKE